MTLRPFARRCALNVLWRDVEGKNEVILGGWMGKRKSSVELVAGSIRRKSSGKASSRVLGGAAIACMVIGCGWTIYSNVIAASVYPTLGNAGYDEPVVRPRVASRSTAQIIADAFAALPMIEKPVTVAAISPTMFNERFAASAPDSVPSNAASAAPAGEAPTLAEAPKTAPAARLAEAKPADAPKSETAKPDAAKGKPAPQQLALNAPAPSRPETPHEKSGISVRDMAERAKAAVMSITTSDRSKMVEKLWGKSVSQGTLLAYASADANITSSIGREQNPMMGGQAPYDKETAVYDITAHTVYLPDGTKLEAHSGLGSNLDDPRSAKIRMRGVTPPHIYELKPREALFHGVPALRLTPVGGEDAIYGRDGLLAHTFMLGPNGDSNGCVSFRDYYAFLDAYRNKGIRKLAVLARIE
jgi:type VI secretion system (T6SS) effector TldE1-like protein